MIVWCVFEVTKTQSELIDIFSDVDGAINCRNAKEQENTLNKGKKYSYLIKGRLVK